jgi:CheY-like chemotaxis protein
MMDSGAGRILVVDDNAALLKVIEAYLSRLGYRVDACAAAAAAWALIEGNLSLYAVALVDLNMPGMRGEELIGRILDANASIRLVAMSGYPAGMSGENFDGNRVAFLRKPFAPQELAEVLK